MVLQHVMYTRRTSRLEHTGVHCNQHQAHSVNIDLIDQLYPPIMIQIVRVTNFFMNDEF